MKKFETGFGIYRKRSIHSRRVFEKIFMGKLKKKTSKVGHSGVLIIWVRSNMGHHLTMWLWFHTFWWLFFENSTAMDRSRLDVAETGFNCCWNYLGNMLWTQNEHMVILLWQVDCTNPRIWWVFGIWGPKSAIEGPTTPIEASFRHIWSRCIHSRRVFEKIITRKYKTKAK